MEGCGKWEDEYNIRANRIPNVNQKLLAEIGTDLKHRLASLPSSNWTSSILSLAGKKTRKETLVDEAINTLTELTNKRSLPFSKKLTFGETTINPLHTTGTDLYEKYGKVTGKYGKQVFRDAPPKYRKMDNMLVDFHDMYNDASDFHEIPNTMGFNSIYINEFDLNKPIAWGKFNAVFVTGTQPTHTIGHMAVLIRNLTDPISYTWYDSHGYKDGWNNPRSYFYFARDTLNHIVNGYKVDFNDVEHQCTSPLCQSFAKIRITYPNLSNQQYDEMLLASAREIANNPEIYNTTFPVPFRKRGTKESRIVNIENMQDEMKHHLDPEHKPEPNPDRTAAEKEGFYSRKADVLYTPVIASKVFQPLVINPYRDKGFGKPQTRIFPKQYSLELQKVLKAISIGTPNVVGSSANDSILYSADYDLLERVIYNKNSVKLFQQKIKTLSKIGKIVDIKCGEITEWNLLKKPFIKNGLVKDYSQTKELEQLNNLWSKQIISDSEYKLGKSLLKKHITAFEYLKAKKELRFGILRWSLKEIEDGTKIFRERVIYLEDAMKSKGITKIDVIAWVNIKYVEVSNIILWIKSSNITYAYIPSAKKALSEDILYYESEGNYMKVGKRILSLANHFQDTEIINSLTNILNSPIGKLYISTVDLEVLNDFPDAIRPIKKRKELDLLRNDFAKLFYPELKGIVPNTSLLPKMYKILQEKMKNTLKEHKLLPIPQKYQV